VSSDQLSQDYPQAPGESSAAYAKRLDSYRRVANPASPAEYLAAAESAGLTGGAQQAAMGGAAPVQALSFDDQLAASRQQVAALQRQLDLQQANFQRQFAQLSGQVQAAVSAIPAKVDPVTESATKVAQAFRDIVAHDAKNILHSALTAHLVALGLEDLAALI